MATLSDNVVYQSPTQWPGVAGCFCSHRKTMSTKADRSTIFWDSEAFFDIQIKGSADRNRPADPFQMGKIIGRQAVRGLIPQWIHSGSPSHIWSLFSCYPRLVKGGRSRYQCDTSGWTIQIGRLTGLGEIRLDSGVDDSVLIQIFSRRFKPSVGIIHRVIICQCHDVEAIRS